MSSDLTFITNEKDKNLKDRFEVLIKDTKFLIAWQDSFIRVNFMRYTNPQEKNGSSEFFVGKKEIIKRMQDIIEVRLNNTSYSVKLTVC